MALESSKKQVKRNAKGQIMKGYSGNPNGRPLKGYSITEMIREMLASDPDKKAQLGRSIMEKALSGDTTSQKMIWEHMDGKPKQTVEYSKGVEELLDTADNEVDYAEWSTEQR